jgi:hypothetical protein
MTANDLAGRAQPGPPRRGGRWPGASRQAAGSPELGEHLALLRRSIGDLSRVLAEMSPAVLTCRSVALDATGTASGSEKRRYAAIAVSSFSGLPLTIAAGPLAGNAPGPGPGVARLEPGGSRVYNFSAASWSIYGGALGDIVYVETFSRPQPLAFDAGTAGIPFRSASITGGPSNVTSPGALQVLASAVLPGPGEYQVDWTTQLGGTTGVAEVNNCQLILGAAVAEGAIQGQTTGAIYPQIRVYVLVPAGGATLAIETINAGTVASVYRVGFSATQVGP